MPNGVVGNGNGVWRWVAGVLGLVVIALLGAAFNDVRSDVNNAQSRVTQVRAEQSVDQQRLTALETNQRIILTTVQDIEDKLDRLLAGGP